MYIKHQPDQNLTTIFLICQNKIMKLLKPYIIAGIVLSLIIIITAISITRDRLSTSGRATGSGTRYSSIFSKDNSYIFASPISALADGETAIRITVFLLDSQGLGVSGQKTLIIAPDEIEIDPVQQMTDQYGKAIFDATSAKPGDYTINVSVSNAVLPQTVHISYQ